MTSLAGTSFTTSHDLEMPHAHALNPASTNGKPTEPLNQSKEEQVDKRSSKKYKHTFAVHARSRTSCLSHEAEASPSFLGFRNLMALVLIVSNLRLMIENFKKYGLLVCIRCNDSGFSNQDALYGSILYLSVPCHLFVAYIIELAAAQQAKGAVARTKKAESSNDPKQQEKERRAFLSTWRLIAFAHGINATLNLVIATWVVYYRIHNPGIGTLCELHAVIVWLKTCSYAFTNRDLRHASLHPTPGGAQIPELYTSCPYPRNITLGNLCYFWWAPTLVYQPVYPRTDNVRWGFVAKRVLEVLALCIVIWIASAQYAVPLLQNSLKDISTLNLISILERLMKLSTISLVCWLAGFFALFQSFLNALAEMMRFGDREFYGDWWNASNVRVYWTSWNKPVFNFMKRHIYSPLVGRGVPPVVAQIITFLFSGILHELLVGVPTHNILGVAFVGMAVQLPLIFLTDPLAKMKSINGKMMGNVIFWVSFCLVGQPLAALLYFFAWQAKYGTVGRPAYPELWTVGRS